MEGSVRTIPSPRTNTSVFAVPRSIARSSENFSTQRLKNITPFDSFQIYHVPRGGSSPAEPRRYGALCESGEVGFPSELEEGLAADRPRDRPHRVCPVGGPGSPRPSSLTCPRRAPHRGRGPG